MGKIIASLYEIECEIGSGGGGIVYLGKHLRLQKKVVLKRDKRSLSVRPEILRREVDALKDLSHSYIPQVYDFIEEDGYVYTVMDYIEGESFDKPLKRGERFSQPQVIRWACQLLEALVYLHQYPPHGILHADIKPANVMLTPQNDIRLIDFNIALALGEEGAIAVGRSFGYASPEHYGTEFLSASQNSLLSMQSEETELMPRGETTALMTEILGTATEPMQSVHPEQTPYSYGKKLLDVRSDIYSLGATLYHILTGKRPARRAEDVEPISPELYSAAVIVIIEKAMAPLPEDRFQSAQEMLDAFRNLRQEDPRTIRYRKLVKTTAIAFGLVFLVGVGMTFAGLKQMEQRQEILVLSEYSENALRSGDTHMALTYALDALKKGDALLFEKNNAPQAQKALTDALNPYDLSDGYKTYGKITLPSEPLALSISPEGRTGGVLYEEEFAIFDIASMEILYTLPAEHSAHAELHYIDENRIVYAGGDGVSVFDLAQGKTIWTGEPATAIAVSADGTTIAAIYKEETHANLYAAADGKLLRTVDFEGRHQAVTANDIFANPEDHLLALNGDGSYLGVSFADGSLMLYGLRDAAEGVMLLDASSGFTHFEGGFSGDYFAFSGTNSESSVFAVIDSVNLTQTGGFASDAPFGVQADESGIYVQTENILVKLHPVTGEQTPLVTTAEQIKRFARKEGYTLISTKSGCSFYDKTTNAITSNAAPANQSLLQLAGDFALIAAIDAPEIRILSLENHADTQVFSYDMNYPHTEARISADGETVMLFAYDHFRLYRQEGEILAEVSIPDAEQVYDQQYRREGERSYLEVIYNDGLRRLYSAADGSLMEEYRGEMPDRSLYQEFFTDTLRIAAPLHGTPIAYEKDSGKQVKELEKDAYLTYVTQVGEYIITEYLTAESERFGLLLNADCETLAYLPQLCDIREDELIFDYASGDLRKTRIYHINELKEMAQKKL